ncbi:UDP-N-acetylmuramoyl-L-alanyl-D-glutamate--2,6-diaminopimelate ligase [Aquipuribacter sp. MA13-6]|uniref:UDP-N-acetylmuramoyl-L-alanyl-D-glutamate--2, 6-diaminopimelate ligase n=1 Tax=unclassified Aquipuribacter TaxID=2635084 RepID=UPI003EED5DC4
MPTTPPTVRELSDRHDLRLRLLPGAAPSGDGDHRSATGDPVALSAQVTGVSLDSRRTGPGVLYAALPGASTHGAHYVDQAVRAGSVAVLTDLAGVQVVERVLHEEGLQAPPVLLHDDPREVLGRISADVFGDPSAELALVGVTGTNGKTTVSTLLDEVLRALGVRTGLVGTIRSRIGDEALASSFTTPEAPDLQQLLRRMADAGCRAVSAEVSSHALAQHRVDGTRFALVVFTNLSRDHLDFHGTLAGYFAAKLRLFTGGFASRAVVGVDDRWGRAVADAARENGLAVLTVGAPGTGADVTVAVRAVEPSGRQQVAVTGPFGPDGALTDLQLRLGMPGAFNATNAALALSAVHLLLAGGPDGGPDARPPVLDRDVDLDELVRAVTGVAGVPGRMERVGLPGRDDLPLVVVDYAHTPEAVVGAVAALRAATPGRLVVVLGAGGDRDRGKRQGMGEAASAADLVVVTDDNPRGEDPALIRAAVLAGVGAPVLEVGDRAEAVAAALAACAGPDDTVLLAGKGHETGQTVGGTTTPFDDRAVARDALVAWRPTGGGPA